MSQLPIIAGLCLYVLLTLSVGIYASRRVKDSVDFVVAGRRLGLVLTTGTLSATWFGTGTVLGAAGAAYKGGFLAVIADPFGAALCLFLAGMFYVRMMRRAGVSTIAEFFERRFGKTAGVLTAACTIPAYLGWVASLMVGFGKIIHALTGLDAVTGTCIGAAIVLIYTAAGGMWAVTLTDFIQVAVLTLGLIFMTPILLNDMGGWAAIRAQIPDDQFYLYPRDAGLTTWAAYVRDWLVIGLGNLAGQDLLQRSLSSRGEAVAQNSAYLSGVIYLTVGLLPVFLGLAATLTFPNLGDPEQVMIKLAQTYLPPLGIAVFIGALISALMSSADSALLAPASVIGNDLIRYLRPEIDAQTQLRLCPPQRAHTRRYRAVSRAFAQRGLQADGRFLVCVAGDAFRAVHRGYLVAQSQSLGRALGDSCRGDGLSHAAQTRARPTRGSPRCSLWPPRARHCQQSHDRDRSTHAAVQRRRRAARIPQPLGHPQSVSQFAE